MTPGMQHETTIGDLPVMLKVTGGHKGSPGHWNPRDGGSPPEGPEIEFRVLLVKDGRDPLDITDYLDDDTIEGLHDVLVDELSVTGAFDEPDYGPEDDES